MAKKTIQDSIALKDFLDKSKKDISELKNKL